jgi:RNA polymerase sigma-70 factor (ECF subfamily)
MNKNSQTELEQSFIQMIRENERVIYKVCSFYVSEQSTIEDLYQEAVLNLWKSFPKFKGESNYSTWIYRVSLNSCISDLRKMSRHKGKVSLSFSEEIAFEPDNMEEEVRELYRLINQLTNLERAIILLWLEEKSYQEIAEISGLSVSNVATKLKRIKEKLRKMSNQ